LQIQYFIHLLQVKCNHSHCRPSLPVMS